jgi:cysteine-rich repeat protein
MGHGSLVMAGLLIVLGSGCTHANPDFEGATEGSDGSSSISESGPDTVSGSGTSAGSDSGASTTSDSTSDSSGPSSSTTDTPASCGNGELDAGEECDPAAPDTGDCHANCTLNTCGDGKIAGDEPCDDGNDIDTDTCTNLCHLPACGDGILSDSEDCEEGINAGEPPACTQFGFENGQVGCLDCAWSEAACYTCGDGILNREFEICEPSIFPAEVCSDIANSIGDATVACTMECVISFAAGECCIADDAPIVKGLECCSGSAVGDNCTGA